MKGTIILLSFTSIFIMWFTLEANATAGLILYFIYLIFVCGFFMKKESLNDFDKLVVVISVVPLIKMLQIFIDLPSMWKIIVSYIIFLGLTIYYLLEFKVDLKLRENLLTLPLAILIGAIFGVVSYFVAPDFSVYPLYLLLLVVVTEELFFRGLFQNIGKKIIGNLLSILIPAIFFGLTHYSFGNLAIIYFFFAGLISGIIYSSTRNILASILFSLTFSTYLLLR